MFNSCGPFHSVYKYPSLNPLSICGQVSLLLFAGYGLGWQPLDGQQHLEIFLLCVCKVDEEDMVVSMFLFCISCFPIWLASWMFGFPRSSWIVLRYILLSTCFFAWVSLWKTCHSLFHSVLSRPVTSYLKLCWISCSKIVWHVGLQQYFKSPRQTRPITKCLGRVPLGVQTPTPESPPGGFYYIW